MGLPEDDSQAFEVAFTILVDLSDHGRLCPVGQMFADLGEKRWRRRENEDVRLFLAEECLHSARGN